MNSLSRVKILQLTVVGVVLVLLVRLFYLQVVDDSYKTRADNNATVTAGSWYRARRRTT